jgi:hypothetical protein
LYQRWSEKPNQADLNIVVFDMCLIMSVHLHSWRCEETKLKASDFTAPSFLQQLCGKMLKKPHTSPYPKGTAL